MFLKKLNLAFIIIALIVILAACGTSESTVTDLEDPIVESIQLNDQFTFAYGTTSQEIINNLPETTEVQFNDSSTETFQIDWTAPADFSATTPGNYIFIADIIDLPREVEIEIIIESQQTDDGDDQNGSTGDLAANIADFNIKIDQQIAQGDPIIIEITDIKDDQDQTPDDGIINLEITSNLSQDVITIADLEFIAGSTEPVEIFSASQTQVSAETYTENTITIADTEIPFEFTITPVFGDIKLLTTEVLQGDQVIVDLEASDLAGDPWNGEYKASFNINTVGSYLDTIDDINYTNGLAESVAFDIDTKDLDPGQYDVTLIGGNLFDGINESTTLEIIGGPEILDLTTTNPGSTASAYVGQGGIDQGRIEIETVKLGQSSNDWEVKVIRQNTSSNLHVDINVSTRVITIDLDTVYLGAVNPIGNSAAKIADMIESTGYFTTRLVSSGQISFTEENSFTGGENIELEITWDQTINGGSNNSDFTLNGNQAFFANTINGTTLTTIAFDNFDKIASGDYIQINQNAVTSVDTPLGNSEITFLWDGAINNWK